MHPSEKIVRSLEDLAFRCAKLRAAGERIVLTSGCFDLYHRGHLQYVCDAADHGSILVVGINSDDFVRRLKDPRKPIQSESDRAFIMAGFYPVRLVAVFDDDLALIRAVHPHVYVAYAMSEVRVGADKVRSELLASLGTEVIELNSEKTGSTTNIIGTILERYGHVV